MQISLGFPLLSTFCWCFAEPWQVEGGKSDHSGDPIHACAWKLRGVTRLGNENIMKCSPCEHQNSWDFWVFTPLTLIIIGFDTHPNIDQWGFESGSPKIIPCISRSTQGKLWFGVPTLEETHQNIHLVCTFW